MKSAEINVNRLSKYKTILQCSHIWLWDSNDTCTGEINSSDAGNGIFHLWGKYHLLMHWLLQVTGTSADTALAVLERQSVYLFPVCCSRVNFIYSDQAKSEMKFKMWISMGKCKEAVTPVRQQWSYAFLVLTHRFVLYNLQNNSAFKELIKLSFIHLIHIVELNLF